MTSNDDVVGSDSISTLKSPGIMRGAAEGDQVASGFCPYATLQWKQLAKAFSPAPRFNYYQPRWIGNQWQKVGAHVRFAQIINLV